MQQIAKGLLSWAYLPEGTDEWRSASAEAFLDEIPGAYTDIDQVMEDAKDLVEIDRALRQILNVKGD